MNTWSYPVGRMLRLHRWTTWGDLRHWEVFAGQLLVYRWCSGAPCHLATSRHPVRLSYRRRRR